MNFLTKRTREFLHMLVHVREGLVLAGTAEFHPAWESRDLFRRCMALERRVRAMVS